MYLNALLFLSLSMSNMCMSMYVKLYESAQMSYYVNVYICQSANILPVKEVYLFIYVISSPWNSIFLSDIFARIELFTNSYSVTTYLDYVIDFFFFFCCVHFGTYTQPLHAMSSQIFIVRNLLSVAFLQFTSLETSWCKRVVK